MSELLSFRQAIQSPCLSCRTSPCCSHLMLQKFQITDLGDVDYVRFLSNFEGILLAVDEAGAVRVYLHQPCRHLDDSGLCNVHGTAAQPSICVHYNSHSCQYRYGVAADLDPRQPLLDRQRAGWYADHVVFTEDRRVAARPDWDELLEAFAGMPLARTAAPSPAPDAVLEEWRQVALVPKPEDGGYQDHHFSDAAISDPCDGCEAWCCKTLMFGRGIPEDANQFDFFRYCLGFPSVELAVSEEAWAIAVRTTCRNLVGNRCSVYGTPDRPLRCGYYDALKCSYRDHFGQVRPADLVRVTRETFPVLESSVVFDERGRVRRVPGTDRLRFEVEKAMRSERTVAVESSTA